MIRKIWWCPVITFGGMEPAIVCFDRHNGLSFVVQHFYNFNDLCFTNESKVCRTKFWVLEWVQSTLWEWLLFIVSSHFPLFSTIDLLNSSGHDNLCQSSIAFTISNKLTLSSLLPSHGTSNKRATCLYVISRVWTMVIAFCSYCPLTHTTSHLSHPLCVRLRKIYMNSNWHTWQRTDSTEIR